GFREPDRVRASPIAGEPPLHFLRRRGAAPILVLLSLYKSGDAFASAMLRPFLADLGLGLSDIGILLGTVGFPAGLFGAPTGAAPRSTPARAATGRGGLGSQPARGRGAASGRPARPRRGQSRGRLSRAAAPPALGSAAPPSPPAAGHRGGRGACPPGRRDRAP